MSSTSSDEGRTDSSGEDEQHLLGTSKKRGHKGGKQQKGHKTNRKKPRVADGRTVQVDPAASLSNPTPSRKPSGGSPSTGTSPVPQQPGNPTVSGAQPESTFKPWELPDDLKSEMKALNAQVRKLWNTVTHVESEEEAALILPQVMEPLGALYGLWLEVLMVQVPSHCAASPEFTTYTKGDSEKQKKGCKSKQYPIAKISLHYLRDLMDWFRQWQRCKPFAKNYLAHIEDKSRKVREKLVSHQRKLESGKTTIALPLATEAEDLTERVATYTAQKKDLFALLDEGERFPWQLPAYWLSGGSAETQDSSAPEAEDGDGMLLPPPEMILLPPSAQQEDPAPVAGGELEKNDSSQKQVAEAARKRLELAPKWFHVSTWEELLEEQAQKHIARQAHRFHQQAAREEARAGSATSRGNSPLLGPSFNVPGYSDHPLGSILHNVPGTLGELQEQVQQQRLMLEPPVQEEAEHEGSFWLSMDPIVFEVTALCGCKVVPVGSLAYLPHNDSVRSYLTEADVDFVVQLPPSPSNTKQHSSPAPPPGGQASKGNSPALGPQKSPGGGGYVDPTQIGFTLTGSHVKKHGPGSTGSATSSANTTPQLTPHFGPMAPQMGGDAHPLSAQERHQEFFHGLQRKMDAQGIRTEVSGCGRKLHQLTTTAEAQQPTATAELVLAVTVPFVGKNALASAEEVVSRIFWEGSQWNSILKPNLDSAVWVKNGNRRKNKISHVFVCTLETVEAEVPLELALSAMWKLVNLDPPPAEEALENKMLDAATATALFRSESGGRTRICNDEEGDDNEADAATADEGLDIEDWLRKVRVAVRVNRWPLLNHAVRFHLTSYKEGIYSTALFSKYFASQELLAEHNRQKVGTSASFSSPPTTPGTVIRAASPGSRSSTQPPTSSSAGAGETSSAPFTPTWLVQLYFEMKQWFRLHAPTHKLSSYSKCLLLIFYLLKRKALRWINPTTCLDNEHVTNLLLPVGGGGVSGTFAYVTPPSMAKIQSPTVSVSNPATGASQAGGTFVFPESAAGSPSKAPSTTGSHHTTRISGFLPSVQSLDTLGPIGGGCDFGVNSSFDHLKPQLSPRSAGVSLADFLKFYSEEFEWWKTAVSIDLDNTGAGFGCPVLGAEEGASMDIRDPFNPNRNTCRHMTYKESRKLRQLMKFGPEGPVPGRLSGQGVSPMPEGPMVSGMSRTFSLGDSEGTPGSLVAGASPSSSSPGVASRTTKKRTVATVRIDGLIFTKQTIKDFIKALKDLSGRQEGKPRRPEPLARNSVPKDRKSSGGEEKPPLASFGVHDVNKIALLGEAVFGSRAFDETLRYRYVQLQDVCECTDVLEAVAKARLAASDTSASKPTMVSKIDGSKPYLFDRLKQSKYLGNEDQGIGGVPLEMLAASPTPDDDLTEGEVNGVWALSLEAASRRRVLLRLHDLCMCDTTRVDLDTTSLILEVVGKDRKQVSQTLSSLQEAVPIVPWVTTVTETWMRENVKNDVLVPLDHAPLYQHQMDDE